jgi:hypothetical protein
MYMKWIRPKALLIVALLAVVAGIVFLSQRQNESTSKLTQPNSPDPQAEVIGKERKPEPGFLDYVKDPQLRHDLENAERNVDSAILAARSWTDDQVASAVSHFVFEVKTSREAKAELRVLRSLAESTHPTLMTLLRDSNLRNRLVTSTGEDFGAEAPFDRICLLLEFEPPAELVEVLVPFLEDESTNIRKHAALLTGSVGIESIIVPVRKALMDADEYVRSYALIGLERAIKSSRLSDVTRRELFLDIQRLIAAGKNSDHAAILLKLDQKRSIDFFLSDDQFKRDSRSLHDILRAMNDHGLSVPRDRLLALIDSFDRKKLEYPHTYQLAEALIALGEHGVDQDRQLFEKYSSHPESTVAEGAADGLLASHGLRGFRERLYKLLEERGPKALTVPQHHYRAISMLDAEVRNGGFNQYFFNSSGDEWRTALAGLEEIGSKERLEILREAVKKFRATPPSTNREKRMLQLSELAKENDNVFDDLDRRYYKSSEVIGVMTMRYVLKKPEAFR